MDDTPRLTRIDPELAALIDEIADRERRSFAGQVNYLLRLALDPDGGRDGLVQG